MGAGLEADERATTVTGGRPLTGLEVDLTDMPDTVQTLAVVALFARGRTRITGAGSLRVKETDRLAALEAELARLGARVETGPDWISIDPPERRKSAALQTYDDHRMAMSLALAGLRDAEVTILGPGCVSKTFPDYFERLDELFAP